MEKEKLPFTNWFWGARYVPCFICSKKNDWRSLWVAPNRAVGGVYLYECGVCKLRSVQILAFYRRWFMCWIWTDEKFCMEVDVNKDEWRIDERKPTYDISELLEKVKMRGMRRRMKEDVDAILEEHAKRWNEEI